VYCADVEEIGTMVPAVAGVIAVHVTSLLLVGLVTLAVNTCCTPGLANRSVGPFTVMITGPSEIVAVSNDFPVVSTLLVACIVTEAGAVI
jgi:hypothetical protein